MYGESMNVDGNEDTQFPAISRALDILRERLGVSARVRAPLDTTIVKLNDTTETGIKFDGKSDQLTSIVSTVQLYDMATTYGRERNRHQSIMMNRHDHNAHSLFVKILLGLLESWTMRWVLFRWRLQVKVLHRLKRCHRRPNPIYITKQQVVDKWGKSKLAFDFRRLHLEHKYFNLWLHAVWSRGTEID